MPSYISMVNPNETDFGFSSPALVGIPQQYGHGAAQIMCMCIQLGIGIRCGSRTARRSKMYRKRPGIAIRAQRNLWSARVQPGERQQVSLPHT